jgi:L-threonylcarbamoyladenylate synthase
VGVVEDVVAAVKAGRPVVLPTDTVYGLAADAYREPPARRLAQLKGRPETQPIALVACDVEMLLECVPELRGRSGTIVRRLLPGPYTLVLPNPARRFRWLSGDRAETIGVRVPQLAGDVQEVLLRLGAVAATSANRHGEREPRRLDEVAEELRAACVCLDGGELPGTPSTVLDFTGPEPRVLREGAAPSEEALALL